MTEATDFSELITELHRDPSLAPFFKPGGVIVLWSEEGRVLWASASAAPLVEVLVRDGVLDPGLPAGDMLRGLAGGRAPKAGVRLERLRLTPGPMGEPVTLACRLVPLPSGGSALATAVVGGLPRRLAVFAARPGPSAGPGEPAATQAPVEEGEPSPQLPASDTGAGRPGPLRFLWTIDEEGVFTRLSPELAEAVGEEAANVLGRRWTDLCGDVVRDPQGAVAEALKREETWRVRDVLWRAGTSARFVPVELAGVPVRDGARRFRGFSGFGVCRMDKTVEAPQEPDAPSRAPEPPAEPSAESNPASEAPRADPGTGPAPREAKPADGQERASDEPAVVPFGPVRAAVAATLGAPKIVPLRVADARTGAGRDRSQQPNAGPRPTLSPNERNAFREIARALGARYLGEDSEPAEAEPQDAEPQDAEPDERPAAPSRAAAKGDEKAAERAPAPPADRGRGAGTLRGEPSPAGDRVEPALAGLAERLPLGILVSRGDDILYANRVFLDLLGYESGAELAEVGLWGLFANRATIGEAGAPIALHAADGEEIAVEARLGTVEWEGAPATVFSFRRLVEPETAERLRRLELDLRAHERRIEELSSILDTATDGVVVLDNRGRILSLNRSAEALFGYDQSEVAGEFFAVLLAPESHAVAVDYLEGLKAGGVASVLNDGREVTGLVRQGGRSPLTVTIGRISDIPERKFCLVVRDMTATKKAEADLLAAKRAAEEASAQKSDFLAKVSHELRTPLNAIIGFAEVMLEERFGPIGNERYKEYLSDIHVSGGHVISLINDLLDLAKIEAGRMELSFTSVSLNDVVASSVALMQPQANRERIVLRTSLAPRLPPVVADERAMRQIVLNVLSNAVKFTDAGGQVIVSTTLTDRGEVALRVRDTGIGMSEKEIEAALEPFRQLATSRRPGGTGLGLPLTKALVEANRGTLSIRSAKREGTLVEIVLPRTRVLAD